METERLHERAIIIDGHCDTVLSIKGGGDKKRRDFFERSDRGHIDLPRLLEGGVTCQVMALYIEPEYKPTRSARRTLTLLDTLYGLISAGKGFTLAKKVEDIKNAKAKGEVCALISIEGGEAVEGSLSLLRGFYRLGVRAMGLTWNQRNDIADGVGEKSSASGLTDFGLSLVREMENLGMIVDVSHLSDSSFWSLDGVAERPYVASHSNCRALCAQPRNLTDRQIEAVARKGGVVGAVFVPAFVGDKPDKVSLKRFCDHIDHLKKVGGIDCVALGSDFDGYETVAGKAQVLKDVSEPPLLTRELQNRGYSEEEILKILGGNWLRVYEEVLG